MPSQVFLASASASKVLIDGADVAGVQAIDFKIQRNRQNIHTLSTDERVGSYYGAVYVQGIVKIRSHYPALDQKMYETIPDQKYFQMVVELAPQGSPTAIKKLTFDECILESKSFNLDATATAVTTYEFTSTRVREE